MGLDCHSRIVDLFHLGLNLINNKLKFSENIFINLIYNLLNAIRFD